MSPISSALTIAESTTKSAVDGDTTEIHYGVSTSADQATGTYSDTIVYTVTGEGVTKVAPVAFATDSWETIISAVAEGDYPYEVGDTKDIDMGTYGTQTIRISNTSECTNSLSSKTACGFVLEFATAMETGSINGGDGFSCSNTGGWGLSLSATHLNTTVYDSLPEPLKSAVVTTDVISSQGYYDSSNSLTQHKLYLLSPEEVFGASFTDGNDTSIGTSRQLDYYKKMGTSTSNTSASVKRVSANGGGVFWWSRSAQKDSSCYYYSFIPNGNISNCYGAYESRFYYSPAFRIK